MIKIKKIAIKFLHQKIEKKIFIIGNKSVLCQKCIYYLFLNVEYFMLFKKNNFRVVIL